MSDVDLDEVRRRRQTTPGPRVSFSDVAEVSAVGIFAAGILATLYWTAQLARWIVGLTGASTTVQGIAMTVAVLAIGLAIGLSIRRIWRDYYDDDDGCGCPDCCPDDGDAG